MLRREALPLYGREIADALASPRRGALVTLWPHDWKDEGAEELESDWPAFFDVLRTRRPFRGRRNHPGFTACSFAPQSRVLLNIRAISAVVLVFGRAHRVSIGDFVSAWSDRAGVVFTTAEHSSAAHSFVAVLPYTRLVALDEHREIAERLRVLACREGRPFDIGTRNPARFVQLPGTVPGRAFEVRDLGGVCLNPHQIDSRSDSAPRILP